MAGQLRQRGASSTPRHHAEWLSLVEVSGPFLSMPVLLRTFPQGLDAHDPEHYGQLKFAYEEWVASGGDDPAVHRAWIEYVLTETLDFDDADLAGGQALAHLKAALPEHGETLRPDLAILEPSAEGGSPKPRLLIQIHPPGQSLSRYVADSHWKASPETRMMELLHATDVQLGLLTNGEQWMLVNAPRGETTGYASWYANLWFEENITLRAFRTLLGVRRFFGVPENETIEALLRESALDQEEVTNTLGYQVRRAVEQLISALDRADLEHNREPLAEVREEELYRAALTVMMRLVFLFCAEERELLLLGDETYDRNYAVSTLREQLRSEADQLGEEILERRFDAWHRLLAVFRAVHGGVEHEALRIPAYGGHLFDPDRFPFLEGRAAGTSWRADRAEPIPIDNRIVLHLLESLQLLEVPVPGGGRERRRLSFRALDIEQIGHVYQGLLDHCCRKADRVHLSLKAKEGDEPEVALDDLERHVANLVDEKETEEDFVGWLKGLTGRSEKALWKDLNEPDQAALDRLRAACRNDDAVYERVLPFAGLVRLDSFGDPVVIHEGSFYVTTGLERRQTGTHYTPRSLTEPIVQYTLEPLVYEGPAEGWEKEKWRLRSPAELLDLKICDMAVGSGAFVVQACRYLSERLVEAWEEIETAASDTSIRITPYGLPAVGAPGEQILPEDVEERLVLARRLVADQCLYGVDVNPLAVEMAKLSMWLITMDKSKPFTFLDHSFRCGDSLLGVDMEQLRTWSLDRKGEGFGLSDREVQKKIDEALAARNKIHEVGMETLSDIEEKERLLSEAEKAMDLLKLGGDLLLAAFFSETTAKARASKEDYTLAIFTNLAHGKESAQERATEVLKSLKGKEPFHWPLEFPEVFLNHRKGFDAFVGNPPFIGGQKITGALGTDYRAFLVENHAKGKKGSADLCAYFFLNAYHLLRNEGQFGLLATNTIAQGETRSVSLGHLTEIGCSIPRAIQSRKWPGSASLEVAHVWCRKGVWRGQFILEDKPVSGITSFLVKPGTVTGDPYRLADNAGKSFQGSIVLGMGFVLTQEEAQTLVNKDPRNKDIIFPYLSGDDVNSRPDQSPSRWVINFGEMSEEEAKDYPNCYGIVKDKVYPERLSKDAKKYPRMVFEWWKFWCARPELYTTVAEKEEVFVCPIVTKYVVFSLQPTQIVFTHKTMVTALSDFYLFGTLQSNFHEAWTRERCSTLETRLNYSPTDCFETYPFPIETDCLTKISTTYYDFRKQLLITSNKGFTKTYNRFHDTKEDAEDIRKLRELHVEMDYAVAKAYGWEDLNLGHDFHETKQGIRYTLHEEARREVLDRLLALNHERYEEEVKQGLHDPGRKKAGRKKRTPKAKAETAKKDDSQGRLF